MTLSVRPLVRLLVLLVGLGAALSALPHLVPPPAYHHDFNAGSRPAASRVTIVSAQGWTQDPDGLALDPGREGVLVLELPAPGPYTLVLRGYLYSRWGPTRFHNSLEVSRDGTTFHRIASDVHLGDGELALASFGLRPLLLRIRASNPSSVPVLVVDDLRVLARVHPLVVLVLGVAAAPLAWLVGRHPAWARLPSGGVTPPGPDGARPASRGLALGLAAGFLLLTATVVSHHELWRDEWHSWLLARESASLADLVRNRRYDGVPILWDLSLYVLTRFTRDPIGMQLFHAAVATASVYLVVRHAPFTVTQKLLFAAGYFPFFEYAAISRMYALGLLLAFAICALWPRARRRPLILSPLLFLLPQTSVFGLILAVSLFLAWAAESLLDRRHRVPLGSAGATAAILAGGLLLFLVTARPAPDRAFAKHWTTHLDLDLVWPTLATAWKVYVPLPSLGPHFWNTNILDAAPLLQAILGLALLAVAFACLARHAPSLVLAVSATSGILAFVYAMYFGFLRHHGHLFVAFLLAYWISALAADRRPIPRRSGSAATLGDRYRSGVLTVLLAVHAAAGVGAAALDLGLPFSASAETARFIRERWPDPDTVVVAHDDLWIAPVAGQLGRDVYYVRRHEFGTFALLNALPDATPRDVIREALRLQAAGQKDVLVLLNSGLAEHRAALQADARFQLVRTFSRSIVPDEIYHLYIARYPPPVARP